ncbi:glycosyltransferase [Tateyamaria omphalii]|uniref:glycosyltransferase n=1 Tax=Tateyamaria omphalii TaxID=299262 RepID=UPI001C9A05BB|nr:glycosyltransferase [Tateyamaria omphalii]MBY5935552.1 glycosyltransferase [Tateyamaria omphalii]
MTLRTKPVPLTPATTPEDIDVIRGSDLFDPVWYLTEYPDVALLKIDPVQHYLWLGARLGRNPSPSFDGMSYLAANTDVAEAGVNPLLHYLRSGKAEGRWVIPTAQQLNAALMPNGVAPGPKAKPTMNWVMNPDNVGWAYGNNAKMLAKQLPEFEHIIDGHDVETDVALYFDIKIFKMRGRSARRNILRVGGPRPVALTYGDDHDKLRKDVAVFDGIIVLNQHLYDIFAPLHPNVHLIPNALDLGEWHPDPVPAAERPFTVGFAGNLSTTKEAHIKGFRFVNEACEKMGLPLVKLSKGKEQIAREDMKEKFYGAIDCLIHPVAPGKEGCSNVVMEALSMGVPVLTTKAAGFHAEKIKDGDGILYIERDTKKLITRIKKLRDDPALQTRMRREAVGFAQAHHDVTRTARDYYKVLALPEMERDSCPRVAFVPFWEPAANFASSRLRCAQPAELLADSNAMQATLQGLGPDTEIAVVSQLASDATMQILRDNPQIALIYDVCDRYFEDDRKVGGVHAKTRFFELAERADIIVASTIALKKAIVKLGLQKAVTYLPDGIDYRDDRDASLTKPKKSVLWYGNPGRSNFDSARWMIDHVMKKTKRGMKLISRKRSFNHIAKTEDPSFAPYVDICTDWAYDTFVAEMRKCSVCVLSHGAEEQSKSPNRLITAIANGVPAIVATAPACAVLLQAGGMGWAVVQDEAGLDAALKRLDDPETRAEYMRAMQRVIEDRFGDVAIRNKYEALVRTCVPKRRAPVGAPPRRVMFVSHNLNVGEGAPTSLMQTVLGLKKAYNITPTIFAVIDGALRKTYEDAGIEVIVPELGVTSRLATKIISRTYEDMAEAFRTALKEYDIDLTVANTATSLWFASISESAGVPAVSMIRESSDEHVAFDFGPEPVMETCRAGLAQGRSTIFVSDHTRKLWQGSHDIPDARLIPNGIDLSHFDTVRQMDKAPLRKKLGIPAGGVMMVCVGSVNARKSQRDIVEAVAGLPKKVQAKMRLVLVGAKPSAYLDDLKARIAELGEDLANRIHIIGETDNVALWYRAADMFVFASHNESYPRVIVEAMSFGLPVVSSAVFGTQEQVVDGESGLLFPIGDIDSMRSCLRWMLENPQDRARFGEQAETRFWELLTYWEMVHNYAVIIANTARQS